MAPPVRHQRKGAVALHHQHVARGFPGPEQPAVADDDAVGVGAVVVAVDGEHRVRALDQPGQGLLLRGAHRLPCFRVRQLHIRHKPGQPVLCHAVDADFPLLVLIAVVIGCADAGLLPRIRRPDRQQHHRHHHHQHQHTGSFHVDHLSLSVPVGTERSIARQNKSGGGPPEAIFLFTSYPHAL